MKMPKFFIFAIVFAFAASNVFAQREESEQVQPSYEVILHVVVATNNQSEKGKIPPSLTSVITNLKKDFSYVNYNLAATFLERISANGVIGHAGVLNQLDQTRQNKIYYSDWGLSGLQSGKDEKQRELIQFQAFNFGAKVPVVVETNAKGDGPPVFSYENIGIRISKFNLPQNTPTIIGSLATPKTDEFIFLILTVRPV